MTCKRFTLSIFVFIGQKYILMEDKSQYSELQTLESFVGLLAGDIPHCVQTAR
jgi:hypothetical protein